MTTTELRLQADQHTPRHFPGDLVAFLCEEALCSTLVLVRSLLGAEQAPTTIELTYPQPPYVGQYQRFFRCPVRFDADAPPPNSP